MNRCSLDPLAYGEAKNTFGCSLDDRERKAFTPVVSENCTMAVHRIVSSRPLAREDDGGHCIIISLDSAFSVSVFEHRYRACNCTKTGPDSKLTGLVESPVGLKTLRKSLVTQRSDLYVLPGDLPSHAGTSVTERNYRASTVAGTGFSQDSIACHFDQILFGQEGHICSGNRQFIVTSRGHVYIALSRLISEVSHVSNVPFVSAGKARKQREDTRTLVENGKGNLPSQNRCLKVDYSILPKYYAKYYTEPSPFSSRSTVSQTDD